VKGTYLLSFDSGGATKTIPNSGPDRIHPVGGGCQTKKRRKHKQRRQLRLKDQTLIRRSARLNAGQVHQKSLGLLGWGVKGSQGQVGGHSSLNPSEGGTGKDHEPQGMDKG